MTKVEFEISDTQARKWDKYLRERFRGNIGERIEYVEFNSLCEIAIFAFIADELEREARAALAELEKGLDAV